ncbi:uncharacterized protein [Watersipora subatra]|uniref:uncharacterized protein n=1 Tax=Watersipora subatra TaxID=2589382 RepID=UPI00355B7DDC
MNFKNQFLVWFLFFSASIAVVAALSCMVCSSSPQSDDCKPGTKAKKYQVDCTKYSTAREHSCTLTRVTYSQNETLESFERSWVDRGYEDGCAVVENYLGYKKEVCVCSDKDFCNDSTVLKPSCLVTFALCLVGLKLFY